MSHDEDKMDRASITELFRQEYHGWPNVMTPTREDFVHAGKFIAEISSGYGIAPMTWIVGATVLECAETDQGIAIERRYDLSTAFSGHNKHDLIEEARQYVRGLEEQN